jgi:hypothetical protein
MKGGSFKEEQPRTIPVKSVLIWLRGFTGEDLNVIFFQNKANLNDHRKNQDYLS